MGAISSPPPPPPPPPASSPVRFSRRLDWHRDENALALAEAQRRASGDGIVDLTVSNPTVVGLIEPDEATAVAAALGREPARYWPTARGDRGARCAIADAYAAAGTAVDPDRILLTASSSESYGYLAKLLCDPGDRMLVPEPSYPLFDYLARLEGVATTPYQLTHDATATGTWELDLGSVDAALASPRGVERGPARALVVVSPNNPTGSILRAGELSALDQRAARAGVALCADEVFADYVEGTAIEGTATAKSAADPRRRIRTVAAEDTAALTFSLGGLSKGCGLPHLKLGWLVVGGPPDAVAQALGNLDLIADTYLSVGGPVQAAVPELLTIGAAIRARITERVARNRRSLRAMIEGGRSPLEGGGSPLTLLAADGGWSAVVRLPALRSDEDWALALLREDGVLVHPGYFFDLRGATFVVLSLLPEPATFDEGARRLVARVCQQAVSSTVG